MVTTLLSPHPSEEQGETPGLSGAKLWNGKGSSNQMLTADIPTRQALKPGGSLGCLPYLQKKKKSTAKKYSKVTEKSEI